MTKIIKTPLPPDVVAADLEYPSYKSNDPIDHDAGDGGRITFYLTDRIGWTIATLPIARGRRGMPDRTYGVAVDTGTVVRVGQGPHVKAVATIYVRRSRAEALKRYTDLHRRGLEDAGNVRDRISSRRAQGQVERANGRSSWRWEV